MTMSDLVQQALDFGFSHAGLLDPATLRVRPEVRQMCAADLCRSYGRNWTCPPASSSLAENARIVERYRSGLIVQTTAQLEDPYDYETMMSAGKQQTRRHAAFREVLRPQYPHLIALGNGACTICATCTYPDAPCRLPHLAIESMESFGLVVTEVCVGNSLGYYYGENTITYTGCYLLELK